MSTCYITAEPCSIAEFLELSETQGFVIENDNDNPEKCTGGFNMIHPDGRGCFACSEEEHDNEIYVGSMGNPEINGIEMVAEGSNEYREICADEYEYDEDNDDGHTIDRPRPEDCIRLDTTVERDELSYKLRNDMCLDTESYQELSRDAFKGYAEMAFNALAKCGFEKVTLTLYRIPAEEARFKFIDGTCDGPEEGFSDL